MRHKTAPFQNVGQERSQSAQVERAQPAPSAAALHFKIDRITIEGYSAGEQTRFTRALQSNLTELARSIGGNHRFSARRLALKHLALNHLDAGRLPAGATPETAARQLAARILAGVTAGLTKRQTTTTIAGQEEEDHA